MRKMTLPVLALSALSALVACAPPPPPGERLGEATQRFASSEAVLLDFELDGSLFAATQEPADLRRLIEVQLMYSVGQLNGVRSVGRYERLSLSAITASPTASPQRYLVSYHAKLPVAWGAVALPAAYALKLPARVALPDQLRFAARYGATCVDPQAGPVDAGRMFLFYRPERVGCQLAAEDVVTMPVTVSTSPDNTRGRYPEYHRIWQDGAFDVVAVFGRAGDGPNDAGVRAYDELVRRANAYLRSLQPDPALRSLPAEGAVGSAPRSPVRLAARLPDGHVIAIEAILVGDRLDRSDKESLAFDSWYEARTPDADLILYSGHAALGDNVRALMTKGSFRSGKYLVWVMNGCDSFAYLDRTLADRRALLNPEDPSGTKHMDTVSNVMGGYFATGAETSMQLIEAFVSGGEPKLAPMTYEQIFDRIDPEQVIVVTGEEDNEFAPAASAPAPAPAPAPATSGPRDDPAREDLPIMPVASSDGRAPGCNLGRTPPEPAARALPLCVLLVLAGCARAQRSRARGRMPASANAAPVPHTPGQPANDHARAAATVPSEPPMK